MRLTIGPRKSLADFSQLYTCSTRNVPASSPIGGHHFDETRCYNKIITVSNRTTVLDFSFRFVINETSVHL